MLSIVKTRNVSATSSLTVEDIEEPLGRGQLLVRIVLALDDLGPVELQ